MKGIEYEYLIRKAFNCGKNEIESANADLYREFERVQRTYEITKEEIEKKSPRSWNQSIEDIEYDLRKNCIKISRNIDSAIEEINKKLKYKLSDSDKKTLDKCSSELSFRKLPNIKTIEKVISQVDNIMLKYEM